ncbi:hypothetical protein COO60DRAFT_1490121, partial [Scenedesmus sp. NREL 46B-D3]
GAAAPPAAADPEVAAGAHAPSSSEAAEPIAAAAQTASPSGVADGVGTAQGGANAAEQIIADIAAAAATAAAAEPQDAAAAVLRFGSTCLLLGMLMLQTKALQSSVQGEPLQGWQLSLPPADLSAQLAALAGQQQMVLQAVWALWMHHTACLKRRLMRQSACRATP